MADGEPAERQPLLLAIDDLQWSDLASLRWLAYLLPRMEGLELLVVAALRPEAPSEDQALVAQIAADPLAAVLRPEAKLEQARARAELGAALRRDGHRAQAREHLRRAVESRRTSGWCRGADRRD